MREWISHYPVCFLYVNSGHDGGNLFVSVLFLSRAGLSFRLMAVLSRSSKSALHGLIHWLASAYAQKGITVNGVAPARIMNTGLIPNSSPELEKSKHSLQFPR